MRRGGRNKWSHDASPHSDGLVSVTERDGSVTRYQNVEDLASRGKAGKKAKPNYERDRILKSLGLL